MSKYAEKQVKKMLKNNKPSKYTIAVQIKGEYAHTNWMAITHATAKILAKLLS